MTDIQLAHFTFGGESFDRSREHAVAIREARMAADHRGGETAPSSIGRLSKLALTARTRLGLGGSAAAQAAACSCPA